jgi:Leucine-rich repeat (LRR) protein
MILARAAKSHWKPLDKPGSRHHYAVNFSQETGWTMTRNPGNGNAFYRLFPLLLIAALAGCSNSPYRITFNDNVIYDPAVPRERRLFSDPGLQACVNQVLAADATLGLADITLLACPDAGIRNLDGIDILAALEQLEVSNNSISNIAPLASLRNLRVLGIRNNDLGNIGVLAGMPILRFVTLQGNAGISCRQLDELGEKLGNTLTRPATCTR